ncbi:MAG TPA: BatA domain-containing protein, partial [Candidatus Krumholzibacteriaceae bacterium]
MNFLNPVYLFALAAVAVPILIHIFSRRRVPEVPFSTIRFLNRSDRRSMMRINVRRLLLLFLRILAVALVALAFARPVVRGSLATLFPAGGSRAACILLDRSYSMGVEGDGGVAFARAKARVSSILDNLDRGDAVSLVLFDTANDVIYDGDLEKEAVLAALKELGPSWSGTDLRSAVSFGERWLEGTRREVRELYIVSDFQRSALARKAAGAGGAPGPVGTSSGERAPGTGSAPIAAKAARLPIRAFLFPVQTNDASNVSI